MIPVGVLFGIGAMIGWGCADLFATKVVRIINPFRAFFWSQAIGSLAMLLYFLFFLEFSLFSRQTLVLVLVASLLLLIGSLAYFKGLEIGKLSVISPVAACWAMVTVILSLVFLNESLTELQGIGILLAIVGTVLASFKYKDLVRLKLKNLAKGIEYALIALFGWGIFYVFIAFLVKELSWFLPMFYIRVITVIYLLGFAGVSKRKLTFKKSNVIGLLILVALFDVGAFLSYGYGVNSEYTSIVAPISAAYPAVAIILAAIFLKERLELNQYIGIITILGGLILLSM